MAIITEYFTTREDGVIPNRTYSDAGMMIERDGARYEEAIDPVDSGRTYVETEQEIMDAEAEEADYMEALERFGVE